MRFFVFADLRGDPNAAWALVQQAKRLDEAARKRGADAAADASSVEVVCLGNAVGEHAEVDLCLERLRKAHVHLVRGALDAAALGMPGSPDARLQGKAVAAKLQPAQLGYLREATPPRRLVANGKRVLLTADEKPDAGQADVVLHPGARAAVVRSAARLDACPGRACEADTGESPYVLLDTGTGEAAVKFAPWDRTLLRKRQVQ